MKKILMLIVLMFLVSSTVLAVNNEIKVKMVGKEKINETMIKNIKESNLVKSKDVEITNKNNELRIHIRNSSNHTKGVMNKNITPKQIRSMQMVMERFLDNMSNEKAIQQLKQNMIKFENKYQDKFSDSELVNIDEKTGTVKIQVKENVKFLGLFKTKIKKIVTINGNGSINEKSPWYRFLYKKETKVARVGGDRDEHGCIGSAGYTWCDSKERCIRPWEEACE